MTLRIVNYRGEEMEIICPESRVSIIISIFEIIKAVAGDISKSDIKQAFDDVSQFGASPVEKIDYVLQRLNLLSEVNRSIETWLFNELWKSNPQYAVENTPMRRFDFNEQIREIIKQEYESNARILSIVFNLDDWYYMLMRVAKNSR